MCKKLLWKRHLFFSFVMLLWINSTSLHAQPQQALSGNQVHFSVTASETVSNDTLSVTFSHLAEGSSTQQVSQEINQKMRAAKRVLERFPNVISQTGNYRVYPVYKKQRLSHWRGQQDLVLHLRNKPGLVKVLTRLQPYLTYKGMHFAVSAEVQKHIESALLDKAIQRFQAKAERIAKGFMAPSFKIIETRIQQNRPHQPRTLITTSARASSAKNMAPTVEAGESTVQVSISGVMVLPH